MQKIPSVDLRDFLSEDPARKQKFVNEIGKAYEEIGFVALKGHFLDDKLVENLYSEVRNFFTLPIETKEKYEIPGIGGQRGYVSFGKEHAKGRSAGDLKEFWHFGQFTEDSVDPTNTPVYPKNKMVEELPLFNLHGKLAYKALENAGITLLQALSLYLGLEERYFDSKVIMGNSILRAIHYPPITEDPKDAIRAGEHEDINLITLLVGASADGLEVLNKQGNYIAVTEVEDHIVVNVGDMLQRLTNDVLRSTTHRVVNPPKERWSEPRFSIPFFLHPRPETRLDCLPSCVSESNPKKYDDCSADEFLTQRLKEIGLIK
jgi:isopenicillin N synthase-like dioxygenase